MKKLFLTRRGVGFFLLCFVGLLTVSAWSESKSTIDLLKGAAFLEHVRILAADDLEGRGNGGEGIEEAARYIAARFRELGLKTAGVDGTYYQPFSMSSEAHLGSQNHLILEGAGMEDDLRLHRDFEPMTFSAAADIEAPVFFAGYGITAPDHGYDDYEGVDVRGAVVLIIRHVPRDGDSSGPFESERGHATFVSKAVNAKAHGAAALLLVNDPFHRGDEPDELLKFGTDLGAEDLDIPAVYVKHNIVEKLFEAAGEDLAQIQNDIDDNLLPSSFEMKGIRARLNVDVSRADKKGKNVLAYLPPRGSAGDEELVIIGAHYDHVGLGRRYSLASQEVRGVQIHNGADDNASGTAGVLELARVFTARTDLERGILFAAFAGEEMGLLGSSHYARNPTLSLEKSVAMLNMDMIGRLRNDRLYVGGVGSSPEFEAKLEELAAAHGLTLSFSFSLENSSDHISFSSKQIPSLFFFTGLHSDYHRPSDDWDKINPAGAERVLRVAYQMVDYIQSLPERPPFVQAARGERDRPSGGGEGGVYGAYFGSVPTLLSTATGSASTAYPTKARRPRPVSKPAISSSTSKGGQSTTSTI